MVNVKQGWITSSKECLFLKKFRELDGRKDRSERAIGVYNRKMVIPKSAAL